MTSGDQNNQFMSDINVTPFVDVMLVLLIIFMVTAPMMTAGVNVSLPEAEATSLPADQDILVVTINNKQDIFVNDFKVELKHLREKLTLIFKGRDNREVYLKADKDISYGMVVRAMAEIKGAGVDRLGMITVPFNSGQDKI